MHRLALVLAAAVILPGCGGSSSGTHASSAPPVPGPAAVVGAGAKTIYRSAGWAVVVDGSRAVALHRAGGAWRPDRSGRVKVEILGPGPGTKAAATPQVAAQLTARSPLVESSLWVDGRALLVKGGGSPTRGTIYGAPDSPLAPGKHLAVAYGRTATSATAVAWTFRV
ncbi:MAG: hypothetical protein ACRDM1_15565 [Gaiellaceae bacterium]